MIKRMRNNGAKDRVVPKIHRPTVRAVPDMIRKKGKGNKTGGARANFS